MRVQTEKPKVKFATDSNFEKRLSHFFFFEILNYKKFVFHLFDKFSFYVTNRLQILEDTKYAASIYV